MLRLAGFVSATLVALAFPPVAYACSVCAAGDPLVAAGDAAPEGRTLRFALETEWLTVSAGPEALEQTTVRAWAVTSPLHRVNVALSVPVVRKTLSSAGAGAHGAHESRTGLGDVEIGARLFFLDRTDFSAMRRQSLALSLGSSLPTGRNDAGETGADEHSQLGTGGYGPHAGVLYRLEQSRWHAFASASARWRSENRSGYRYGASLGWSVQAQRQLSPWLAFGLGLDGREAAADEQDGAPVPHTGGLVLAAAPSVHVAVAGPLWLTVRAQIPFASRLRGDQDVDPTVSAALQIQVF
jgi:hypothetical protein